MSVAAQEPPRLRRELDILAPSVQNVAKTKVDANQSSKVKGEAGISCLSPTDVVLLVARWTEELAVEERRALWGLVSCPPQEKAAARRLLATRVADSDCVTRLPPCPPSLRHDMTVSFFSATMSSFVVMP